MVRGLNPGGARFTISFHNGPGARSVPDHFPEVNWPGRGVDHPPPYSTEVEEREEVYLYSLSGSSWPVLG